MQDGSRTSLYTELYSIRIRSLTNCAIVVQPPGIAGQEKTEEIATDLLGKKEEEKPLSAGIRPINPNAATLNTDIRNPPIIKHQSGPPFEQEESPQQIKPEQVSGVARQEDSSSKTTLALTENAPRLTNERGNAEIAGLSERAERVPPST